MKTTVWDPAEHLDSDEAVIAYLDAAFEDGSADLILAALNDVGRARGVLGPATSPIDVHESIGSQGPDLATIQGLLRMLGLGLSTRPLTAGSV